MQQIAAHHSLRDQIIRLASQCGLESDAYVDMLDYTINLFESQGLGTEYYGYHNINHELEVTYFTLLAAGWDDGQNRIRRDDLKYLYVAALFHDFDPQKSVDKPHEESVIRFITLDKKLQELMQKTGVDIEVIKALILRTTYPWAGRLKEEAEVKISECFERSATIRHDRAAQEHVMMLGWFLSIADRIAGYALGGFDRGMELAKMNAHALGWHPALLVQRAVAYFENLLNDEVVMTQRMLCSIPKDMRRNFMDNVQSFMGLRQQEIRIQAEYVYENLKLVPVIENMSKRSEQEFVDSLYSIYCELPKPLRFGQKDFAESVRDPDILLNTLRLGGPSGEIIGFAKGGSLERYELRPEIKDGNYGAGNTVFLEPLAIKMGYWGMHGGSEMRHMFTMQAHSKKYTYLTSFALRDVIRRRVESQENAEFVTLFDPERWDYYRIKL